jgi:hypothetical protein
MLVSKYCAPLLCNPNNEIILIKCLIKDLQHAALDLHDGKNLQYYSVQPGVQCIFRRRNPASNLSKLNQIKLILPDALDLPSVRI